MAHKIYGQSVLIPGGDNPIVVSTAEEMVALFTDNNIGKFVKYVGESGEFEVLTETGPVNIETIKNGYYIIVEDYEADNVQYYELPVLDNEGSASDLMQGKRLINSKGDILTGTAEPGDWKLTKTQESMIAGLSTVYSTDAKYITGVLPSQLAATVKGIDAPNCEYIVSSFLSSRPTTIFGYPGDPNYPTFEISLPKCKKVGYSAFYGISKLGDIHLPEVEEIDAAAFAHDIGAFATGDSPHTVYIPKCKKLATNAFYNRSQLSGNLDCPELQEIGTSPFGSTSRIQLTVYPEKITRLSNNWYEKITVRNMDMSNVYLPNCVYFGWSSGRSIRTLSLPECEELQSYALYSQTYISSISLPKVKTISYCTFANFTGSSIILNLPNLISIEDRAAFARCSVSAIVCPKLSIISSEAFSNVNTSNIQFNPSILTRIGSNAFSNATAYLNTLTYKDGAYFMTPSIVAYIPSNLSYSEWSNSEVTLLPDGAFYYWKSLTTVRLDNIKTLPSEFGSGGSPISELYAPNLEVMTGRLSNLTVADFPNVTSVCRLDYFPGKASFMNMPKLRYMSSDCYSFGYNITSYSIGKLTSLTYGAFTSCKISKFDIKTLRRMALSICKSNSYLQEVSLPCMMYFGWNAFQSCTSLSTVLIRSFSSYAGGSTFSDCRSLMSFIATSPTPFSFYSDFASNTPLRNSGYTGSYGSIFVRSSLISEFKAMSPSFSNRFTGLENLPSNIYETLPMPFNIGSLNYAMTRKSTFEEFCNSEFNAEDYVVDNGYVYTSDKTKRVAKDGIPVRPTDIAVDYDYIEYELID